MNENTKNIATGPERRRNEDCGVQKCINSSSEPPELHAVRIETRLRLYTQCMESVSNLSDMRAREIEDLHVRIAAMQSVHAEEYGKLVKRHNEGRESISVTASNLIAFIIAMKASPVQLRRYAQEGTPVNAEAVAQIVDGIAIGLHAIKRMAGGGGEGAVRFPETPQELEDWLTALKTSAESGLRTGMKLNDALDAATGRTALYWCPVCKRHIHPESLITNEAGGYFHPHSDGTSYAVDCRYEFAGPNTPEDVLASITAHA